MHYKKYQPVLVAWGYWIGALMLLPGTILLLEQFSEYEDQAIHWLIASSLVLLIFSIPDYADAWFPGRQSSYSDGVLDMSALLSEVGRTSTVDNRKKDLTLLITHMAVQGGVLFLIASCLYLPGFYEVKVGNSNVTWGEVAAIIFKLSSASYLCGSP